MRCMPGGHIFDFAVCVVHAVRCWQVVVGGKLDLVPGLQCKLLLQLDCEQVRRVPGLHKLDRRRKRQRPDNVPVQQHVADIGRGRWPRLRPDS